MIQWLNIVGNQWVHFFLIWTIQNTLFLGVILLLLHILRNKNVRLLRAIAILGFLKLLIPPVFFSGTVQSLQIVQELPAIIVTPGASQAVPEVSPVLSGNALLFLIWFTIGSGFLLTAVIRFSSLFLLRKNAQPLPAPKDLRNGSLPLIRLYSSEKITSPVIFGLMSYNLLVPVSWKHMSAKMRKAIVHHEIAHLKQKDQLIGILQMFGVALHFFHPIVWVLNHHLNEYCEKSCDDRALVQSKLRPKEYLNSLITMAELSAGKHNFYAPALAFTKSYKGLKSRIIHQVQKKYNSLNLTRLNYFTLLLILFATVIFSCDFTSQDTGQSLTSPESTIIHPASDEDFKVKFVAYDTPPEIVGGMESLRNNITYPQIAKDAGVEGTVIVQAFISKEGNVEEVRIVEGIPRTGLDEAAVEAISNTRFHPALQGDTPVGVWYSIPITFRLKSTSHNLNIHLKKSGDLTLNDHPVLLDNLQQQIRKLDPNASLPVIISGESDVDMALVHTIHRHLTETDHLQVTYKIRS